METGRPVNLFEYVAQWLAERPPKPLVRGSIPRRPAIVNKHGEVSLMVMGTAWKAVGSGEQLGCGSIPHFSAHNASRNGLQRGLQNHSCGVRLLGGAPDGKLDKRARSASKTERSVKSWLGCNSSAVRQSTYPPK